MGTELWFGGSTDDLEKMKFSQYGWYGMDDFSCTTRQNKSKEWIIIVGRAGFTTLLSRSNTGHSAFLRILNYDWARAWMERWDFHSMNGMRWMISMVPRDDDGFKWWLYKIYNNVFAKCRFTIAFTTGSQGMYSQSVRRVHFTIIFTIFTQILCSLFSSFSFIYNMHRGNWVAGSPLFLTLQILLYFLKSIHQQLELPLQDLQ